MVHQVFKTQLVDFETHTQVKDGVKKILVFLAKEISNNKRKKLDIRVRATGPPHLKFVMMKENTESMQAVYK